MRAGKNVNGAVTNFVWNGQNLASESTNGRMNTYTYDMTGIHIANMNGTVHSYLKDTHGSVTGKVNAAGSVMDEAFSYDAFGNIFGDTPDPFGYCGEYYDRETGLIYLRNRYYDTSIGRFITEDPVKDGLNWYAYCGGNPIALIDPLGLVPVMARYIAEKNGGIVSYDESTGIATIDMSNITMTIKYNEKYENLSITVGEESYETDGSIMNGRIIIDSEVLENTFGELENGSTHLEGDCYYSEEDAALAFGLTYNKKSVDENKEYGAIINKIDNKYFYETVFYGESIRIQSAVYDQYIKETSVAMIHSHGGNIKNVASDFFSNEDAQEGDRIKLHMYITTPSGYLKILADNYMPLQSRSEFFIPPPDRIIAKGLPR